MKLNMRKFHIHAAVINLIILICEVGTRNPIN
jgi:hypothetical protein